MIQFYPAHNNVVGFTALHQFVLSLDNTATVRVEKIKEQDLRDLFCHISWLLGQGYAFKGDITTIERGV